MPYQYESKPWPSTAAARLTLLNDQGALGWSFVDLVGSVAYFEKGALVEYESKPWPNNATARLTLLNSQGTLGWALGQVVSSVAFFERPKTAAPPPPPPPPPTPTAGLVAAYGFNEGSGTTVADASGNGHTGTITGATWSTQGKFGACLSFDGVDDWVTINHAAQLNLTTGMTLEAWVFPTASAGTRDVVIKESPQADIYNLYANEGSGPPQGTVLIAAGNKHVKGSATLLINTWSHLATTYDGASLKLFVNGVQVGTTPVTGPIVVSTGVLRIGGNSMWGEFFQGRLDEIRVYNKALTQAQILADMNTPIAGGTTPPPVGTITVSPSAPSFSGVVGTTLAPLNLTITTSTGQAWSTQESSPWFNASPTSGASGGTVTLTPNSSGLAAGTYTQTITVSSSGLPDRTVTVTLVLTATQPPIPPPTFVIEGFGKDTIGGAGGTTYMVTNLNDSGPGSLREAVSRTGRRIVKFSVSGTINLNSQITIINNPFLTIDGSTAPNQGIALRGGGISIDSDNVILRYIRIRPGVNVASPGNNDGVQLGNYASNIVIDHCSISWSTDGQADLNANGKVTMQWCIISEQMGGSGAVLIFYANPQVSFHHNLLAKNGGARHPELGKGDVDWVNNVIYRNIDGTGASGGGMLWFGNFAGVAPGCSLDSTDVNNYCGGAGGFPEGGPVRLNYVGNMFKAGQQEHIDSQHAQPNVRLYGARKFASQSSVYFLGNISPSCRPSDSMPQDAIAEQQDTIHGYTFPITTTRHPFPQITTTSAAQALIDVLAGAGCRLPCLDAVDKRILQEAANGTGDDSQRGIYPDLTRPC